MEISTVVPVESFFEGYPRSNIWKDVTGLTDQVLGRTEVRSSLSAVLGKLPRRSISLSSAMDEGYVTEEEVAKLYASLTELLEGYPEYGRLILYLPFGFLPEKDLRLRADPPGIDASRFTEAYMGCWRRLLSSYDIRANFLDGDVLEVDRRKEDPSRVVKSAHLALELIERDMLDMSEMTGLMDDGGDPLLRESFSDIFPLICGNIGGRPRPRTPSDTPEDVSEKRRFWLERMTEERSVLSAGRRVMRDIEDGVLSPCDMESLSSVDEKMSFIEGLRMLIEEMSDEDGEKAASTYALFRSEVLSLWGDPSLKNRISKMLRRSNRLGTIADRELDVFGIRIVDLAEPVSDNLEHLTEERRAAENVIRGISEDEELGTSLYPMVVLFGSKIKGYGAPDADTDMGIFVRPGTDIGKRRGLREKVLNLVRRSSEKGDIVDFWLNEKFGVTDRDDADPSFGKSHWVHILFGSVWMGEKRTVEDICPRILVPYMTEEKTVWDRDARSLYLEVMEQDVLQYRLMHSGYERFFPVKRNRYSDRVELQGDSVFWDEGFRRLATRLYLDRVFLPKLPLPFRNG